MTVTAQQVFSQRAAFYTTSAAHTDKFVLDRVVELAKPQRQQVALDVATGTGHTAFALAPFVREVVAVDVTIEMLIEARKLKAERGVSNVEFRLADVHELLFDDRSFDVLTCRRAAHHFSNIDKSLDEMKRVLTDGGRLVIDDRSVPEDDLVDVTMNRLDWLHDESHIRQYRASEWERMLIEVGFNVETIESYTQHRPLSSLTDNVDPQNVAEIRAIITALNESQRKAMNVIEKGGKIYLNHRYVMIAAVKSDE
jgi:ubiquinone/menaquinone biosynthesis C-methylase UbiE